MPPILIPALVAGGSTALAGGFGAVIAGGAFASGLSIAAIATSAGLAAVSAGLQMATAPKSAGIGPTSSFVQRTPVFLPDVYGECRVGGAAAYYRQSTDASNNDLLTVWVLAAHGIEDVTEVRYGDELVWTPGGGLTEDYADRTVVAVRLGQSATPTPPADLLAGADGVLDSDFKLVGKPYVYIRFKKVTGRKSRWPQGIDPGRLWFRVKGKPVLDTRTETTAYSANWALCFRDWLVSRGGILPEQFDAAQINAAANLCDESVSIGGDPEVFQPRYVVNGAFRTDGAPRALIGDWLRQGGNLRGLVNAGDRLRILPGAYTAPVADFGADDFLAPVRLEPEANVEDRWDGVQSTFASSSRLFNATQTNRVILSEFSGDPDDARLLELEFARETNNRRAARLGRLALMQSRRVQKVSFAVPLTPANAALLPGQRVTATLAPLGLAGTFEIIERRTVLNAASPRVEIVGLEDDPDFWGFLSSLATDSPPGLTTTLANPFFVSPATGVTVTAARRVEPDGSVTRWVDVAWTAPASEPFLDRYRVEWTQGGEVRDAETTATRFRINNLTAAGAVSVVVYVVNTLDRESAGATASDVTPAGDVTPPGVPPSGSIFPIAGGFRFVVGNPTDADLAGLRLYEGASGAAFGATSAIIDQAATPGGAETAIIRQGLAAGTTRRYFVTAFDRSGNESGAFGPLEETTPTALSPEEIDAAIAAAEAAAEEALTQAGIAVSGTSAVADDLAAETAARIAAIADETSARAVSEAVIRARLARQNMILTDAFDAGVGEWTASGGFTVGTSTLVPAGFDGARSLAIDYDDVGGGSVDEAEYRAGNLEGRTLRISGYARTNVTGARALSFGLRLLLPDGVSTSLAARPSVRAGGLGYGFFSVDVPVTFATRGWRGSISAAGSGASSHRLFAPRVEDVTGLAAAEASVTSLQTAFTDFEGDATAFDILTVTAGNKVARRTIGAVPNGSFIEFDANLVRFQADKFEVANGATTKSIFTVEGGQVVIDGDLVLKGESVTTGRLASNAASQTYTNAGFLSAPASDSSSTLVTISMPRAGRLAAIAFIREATKPTGSAGIALRIDGTFVMGTGAFSGTVNDKTLLGHRDVAAGTRLVEFYFPATFTNIDWQALVIASYA